jgi:GNAT superfamily N-acetyltransferase
MSEAIAVRHARPADLQLIYAFILELAQYERLSEMVKVSAEQVGEMVFSSTPLLHCEIAEADGEPVGFVLWFYNVSSFEGRGLYLEDLFVRPAARGKGAGKALLAALSRICVEENLKRMEWAVLDWNAPAIAFYDRLGAQTKKEWVLRRLSGEPLWRLAGGGAVSKVKPKDPSPGGERKGPIAQQWEGEGLRRAGLIAYRR